MEDVISGRAPIINGIAIVTVISLHCGVTYNITAQGMYNNGTLVGPGSSYGAITTGVCPLTASKGAYVIVHALQFILKHCIHKDTFKFLNLHINLIHTFICTYEYM